MTYRKKTLSFQRAYFNDGFNSTLETVIRNAFNNCPSAKDRIVDVDLLKKHLFASYEDAVSGGGIFVRVLEFEQGAIGVINLDTTDNNAAVDEFFHPNKQDFLKDEIVLYISGNHIVACNMKNRNGLLATNFLSLAQRVDVLGPDVRMQIADIPDQITLQRIQDAGVKEIDFSISCFMENLNISTQGQAGARIMEMIFGMPSSGTQIRKRANSVGRIRLKRGRFHKDEVNKDQWLTDIGKELTVAGSSDNFTIILEDETRVSNAMLRKTKSINIPRHANSYSFDHAKLELQAYYRFLSSDKSLGV